MKSEGRRGEKSGRAGWRRGKKGEQDGVDMRLRRRGQV